MFSESISYSAALFAGLLSFFSPCILPLIPAYFTFITGFSLDELTGGKSSSVRKKIVFSTIAYVAGFSTVFILLGASASFFGGVALQYKDWIRIIGGILIVVLGIHMTGIIRIKGLEFEKRLNVQKKPLHFMGTFLVGMAFGAGWSPCIGPLLGSILIVAGNQDTVAEGIKLLAIYSIGLALPFLVLSLFVDAMLKLVKKASWMIRYVNIAAGILLVIMGLLLATNKLSLISA